MKTLLIEPTDVLFFRDGIPMAAGQGKGAGCRLPFPSTVHEALRSTLLLATGNRPDGKHEQGRPPGAPRQGNWHDQHDGRTYIASWAFRSWRTIGPFPFLERHRDGQPLTWTQSCRGRPTGTSVAYEGLLLPVPLDAAFETVPHTCSICSGNSSARDRIALKRFRLWLDPDTPAHQRVEHPSDYRPLCLPVAAIPPDKHGQLQGWWTLDQMRAYLELQENGNAREDNAGEFFRPLPTSSLWQPEHRIGVEINPATFAASHGQLYAGSYLRADAPVRLLVQLRAGDPRARSNGEAAAVDGLQWLLLGGEQRLARVSANRSDGKSFPDDPFALLKQPPAPPVSHGPCLLKWVLASPALFAHGHLPGWCWNATDDQPPGQVRLGASKRKADTTALPGRAHLISWCLGRPQVVTGWDVVDGCAKPTRLAVPAGSVYYFLCENPETAAALAQKLHWQPRSDSYGEKGCGYGLVSFDVRMHCTSADVSALARKLFNQ